MKRNNFDEHECKTIEEYKANIGKRVCKITCKTTGEPKPFKSGHRTNTVAGVIDHPKLHIPAYVFEEDNTYVECRRCEVVNDGAKTRFAVQLHLRIAQHTSGVDKFSSEDIMEALQKNEAEIKKGSFSLFVVNKLNNDQIMAEVEAVVPVQHFKVIQPS